VKAGSKTELSSVEKRAIDAYLDSVARVPKVVFMFAEKGPDLHIYVGLERRLLRSCIRLYEIQDRIRDEFEGFQADFHIIYADGRSVEEFAGKEAHLIIDRGAGGARKNAPFKGPAKIYRNVPEPIVAPNFGPPVSPQTRSRSESDSRNV
jgi:hypothetical protein